MHEFGGGGQYTLVSNVPHGQRCRAAVEKNRGTKFTEGGHCSPVYINVLGGHYSPVNNVRGAIFISE